MKSAAIFLLKLALTGLCLWWAFSQIRFDRSIFTRPGAIDFRWLAAGAGLAGLTVFFHALRWWLFLRGQDLAVSLRRAVELTLIDGLFSLASVSGLGGDAARVLLLMREHPGKKLVIAMTIMADHLAGLVSIALLFFAVSAGRFDALASQSLLGKNIIVFAWFYLGGGLAMVALMFVCASPAVHARIHAGDRFGRFPIMRQMPELVDVYRRKWRHALSGLVASFAMLVVYFSSYWCGLRAVGGDAGYGAVLSAMPVIDSISGLPVSIAGVGVREKLFQILLHDLAGVPAATAVAASLAGFACNALWAGVGAALFLTKRGPANLKDGAASRPSADDTSD